MDGISDALVIAGMFILRLGVPLAITLAVGYLLLRLDRKWQAEAWAEWESSQLKQEEQAEQAAGRVASQVASPVAGQFCWELKECSQAVREQCSAFKRPNIPCWLARRRAEGRLPAACYECELFSLKQVSQSIAS